MAKEIQTKPATADAERIAQLEGRLAQMEQLLSQSQQLATVAVLEAKVQALTQAKGAKAAMAATDRDVEYAEWRKWAMLTAEQKTQVAADKRWGAEQSPRWRCGFVHPHPTVVIVAQDEVHAKARYLDLCGITNITVDEQTPNNIVTVARVDEEAPIPAAT
jgi:hypothetical protein